MAMPSDDAIRGRWKWFVVFGIVLVVVGLIALWNVVDATLVTTVFVGFMLLLGGLVQIVAAFTHGGPIGWRVLGAIVGLLFAIVGWDIIADPTQGAITLTLAIAIVLIADGIIRLISAFTGPAGHRLLTTVVGIINIVLGAWLWTGIPISGLAIGFFVGLQLLMAGIIWIVVGWMARSATSAPAMRSAS